MHLINPKHVPIDGLTDVGFCEDGRIAIKISKGEWSILPDIGQSTMCQTTLPLSGYTPERDFRSYEIAPGKRMPFELSEQYLYRMSEDRVDTLWSVPVCGSAIGSVIWFKSASLVLTEETYGYNIWTDYSGRRVAWLLKPQAAYNLRLSPCRQRLVTFHPTRGLYVWSFG